MQIIVNLTENLASALAAQQPHQIAKGITAFVETAREMTEQETWVDLGVLAQNLDVIIANAKDMGLLDTKDLKLLGDLGQQTATVLAFLSNADGERMTGYFRGALSNAHRVDMLTDNQLNLRALVELVKKDDKPDNSMITFHH